MAKLLVEILGVEDHLFRDFIQRLERLCLQPSIDIKLAIEIQASARKKIDALALRPDDTEPLELYHALCSRFMLDDAALARKLKIESSSSPDDIIKKIAKVATKLSKNEQTISLTTAGLRKTLKEVVPKKTLRLLGLRSIESVIKRYDPRLIYAIALHIEDASWKTQTHAKLRRAQTKDVQLQSVEILPLPQVWFTKIQKKIPKLGLKIVVPELGVVVVLPVVAQLHPGAVTTLLGTILQASQKLVADSIPYRQAGLAHGYQDTLVEIAHAMQPKIPSVYGLYPTWVIVHELSVRGVLEKHSIEKDLLLNELYWESIESKLTKLVSSFGFWQDAHFLGYWRPGEHPVSFHVLDIARAVLLKTPFGQQPTVHLTASLWNELQIRYLQQEPLTKTLVIQMRSMYGGML